MKSKEVLYGISKMSHDYLFNFVVSYWASHHGHSIIDGHFGVGKTAIRDNPEPILLQSELTGPWAAVANTVILNFDSVDGKQKFTTFSPAKDVKGIRKFHVFEGGVSIGLGELRCWRLASEKGQAPTLRSTQALAWDASKAAERMSVAQLQHKLRVLERPAKSNSTKQSW